MAKKDTTYSSDSFEVKEEIDHIRTNAEMYIGPTETPTHLVEEILDNALDECQGGHANRIAVVIDTEKHEYSVFDNGRGLPFDKDVPITVSNKLFSGAKFKGSKEAYEICSGLHGVGLVAVNALSTDYEISIYRDNKRAEFKFKNSKLEKKSIRKHYGHSPYSTMFKFIPDPKIFESLVPNIGRIRNRLLMASVEMGECTFFLIINGEQENIKLQKEDYFMNEVCTKSDTIEAIYTVSANKAPESFSVMFAFSQTGPITQKVSSSVNLLPVDGGGTHVNLFQDILMTKAKKMGIRILESDCNVGFRAFFSLSLVEPKFSGQTKDRLSNRRAYFDSVVRRLKAEFEKIVENNPEDFGSYINFLGDHRKKKDSKNLKTNTDGKRGSSKFTKLRDCVRNGGELFIVEGDSAGGTFINSRDPNIHAIFPLRGKIPSVVNKKNILKHEETRELIQALGTGVEGDFNIEKLRYDKIIACTDADEDGYHIFCLMTIMLATLVPEIIKQGKYFLAMTPLYAINEKGLFIPLWNEKELAQARKEKRTIQRYKGLGELNPEQLEKVAIDDKTRKLIPIKWTKNLDELLKIFSDSTEKRKLLEKTYELNIE